MKSIEHVLREAAETAGNAFAFGIGSLALPAVVPIAVAGIAAASAAALGTWLVSETGHAILSELHRRTRLREPRPESPSLRGAPTPGEITADGLATPRTLTIRLRLGSRLADLEPTLDSGTHYNISAAGARRFAARGRGVKGWLEDNRIGIGYGTLMRYKRLAIRLRHYLGLDQRLPLEWLLPGAAPTQAIPADLRSQYAAARRRMAQLIRTQRNFSRLSRHIDEKLGIPQLPAVHRSAKRAKCLDQAQVKATKRELVLFLETPNLPPKLEKLRQSAFEWLGAERGHG
jgi:hypothetical protein